MLLFICDAAVLNGTQTRFQYISCYCLSECSWQQRYLPTNFNTSHVTIYLERNQVIMTKLWISIHLMLLFIDMVAGRFFHSSIFQYISCYCLSLRTDLLQNLHPNFNTSHVTVYRSLVIFRHQNELHFNTSHVTVYSKLLRHSLLLYPHFNTSHVTVYRYVRFL